MALVVEYYGSHGCGELVNWMVKLSAQVYTLEIGRKLVYRLVKFFPKEELLERTWEAVDRLVEFRMISEIKGSKRRRKIIARTIKVVAN